MNMQSTVHVSGFGAKTANPYQSVDKEQHVSGFGAKTANAYQSVDKEQHVSGFGAKTSNPYQSVDKTEPEVGCSNPIRSQIIDAGNSVMSPFHSVV